jgi:hypothetical protein
MNDYTTISVRPATKTRLDGIKKNEEMETYDELVLCFIELYEQKVAEEDKRNASQ